MFKKLSFQISLSIIIIAILVMVFGAYYIAVLQSLKTESQQFIAEFNQEEILSFQNEIARTQRNIFIFLVLALLFIIGLVLNVAFIFVYSLRTILSGVERFKSGDYQYQIPLASQNEFGVIADYLNQAIGNVRDSKKSLEAAAASSDVAKARAEEERTKLEVVLESIREGIVVIDKDFNILLWNEEATKISGWAKAPVLNRSLRDFLKFIREKDRLENIIFIEEALLLGKTTHSLFEKTLLISQSGQEIPIGAGASPVFGTDKKIIGAVIVFHDISQEMQSQAIRSEFAYASHQLRTPVTEAIWNLETLLKEKDPKKIKEGVEIAYSSMESVIKLVNQVVEASEIDQKNIIPKIEKVKLLDLFEDVINSLKLKVKEQSIALEIGSISPLLGIETDRKLFKRVLSEVIENAIYYSPLKGKIQISFIVKENGVVIEVQDNGIGIPENQQALVFQKFFRGANIPSRVAGAGLGLYIAQEYIKLLKGKLYFKSEENKGTTLSCFFPIS